MKVTCTIVLSSILTVLLTTSCQKSTVEIRTVRDTIYTTITDTLLTPTKDTSFPINVSNWDDFSYQTVSLINPSPSTYINTEEGIKIFGTGYRNGARLQTKNEISFKNKSIYYKWKANGGGQFASIVPQVKYDPLTNDGKPPIQGVDFDFLSLRNSFENSTLIQNDTWYYTSVKSIAGSNSYLVTTCTGNYINKGGTSIHTSTIPVYTTHGYIAIRIGDTYAGGNSFLVLGECKISD